MNQEKIGRFIASKRKEKNLTQSELGEKLGISYKAISKWENGKSLPDVSLFKKLCQILDISLDEFLMGENTSKDNTSEEIVIKMIKKYHNMDILTKVLSILIIVMIIHHYYQLCYTLN